MMFLGFTLQLFVLVALLSVTSSLPTQSENPSLAGKLHSWIMKHDITKRTAQPCPWAMNIDLEAEGGTYTLMSPNYPSEYDNNQDCSWRVRAGFGKVVIIEFSTSFDVEEKTGCVYDYVDVGGYHYCNGNNPPTTPQQFPSRVTISFHSDKYGAGTGYQIMLTQVDRAVGSPYHAKPPATACPADLPLSINATTTEANFLRMNYGFRYGRKLDCTWVIKTSSDKVLTASFDSLDVEGSNASCPFDYVSINDGTYTGDIRRLFKACNNNQAMGPVVSTSSKMFIKFHSVTQLQFTGFRLTVTAQDKRSPNVAVCPTDRHIRMNATTREVNIQSPNYGTAYGRNMDCTWLILTLLDKVLAASFDYLDVEGSNASCPFDYVSIHDGAFIWGRLLFKACNSNRAVEPVVSTYSQMFIEFHSDTRLEFTGFRLTVTALERGIQRRQLQNEIKTWPEYS